MAPSSAERPEKAFCYTFTTPLGGICCFWEQGFLIGVNFTERKPDKRPLPADFHAFINDMENYLHGKKVQFRSALSLERVTDFQRGVLMECARIPYGASLSYKQLAERAGNPAAARAVGHAMSINPLPIVIPCHRVLHADGTLGGYSSGLDWKRYFLALEGIRFKHN